MIKIEQKDINNPIYNEKGINNYILYLHKSPSNKFYVGITCQGIERRWRFDGSGYYQCKYFYNAIKKYGFNNFEHYIVRSGLDEDTANQCEINMIKNMRDAGYELYNVSNGGRAAFKGLHLSEEHKRKISESNMGRKPTHMTEEGKQRKIEFLKGNKYALGYHHTEETKKRISESLKAKKMTISAEHRKRMEAGRKGKPLSEAQKRQLEKLHEARRGTKMSESAKEKLAAHNRKCVIQYDLNMNMINEYKSLKEAANATGASENNISSCCHGKIHTSGGYIWRLKEDIKDAI